MAKRIKKPPVTPEQTLDWLNRNDLGESAPQIAKKDEYDVRTVRSHIQRAKQERERNEARATVLRGALEDHYKDLCNFALKLDPNNPPTAVIPLLPADDNIMEVALRQHLPRSPIWNLRIKKDRLEQEYALLFKQTNAEIEQRVSAEPRLEKLVSDGPNEIIPGIVLFLSFQLEQWVHGNVSMKAEDFLRVDPDGDGFQLQLGFSRLGFFEKKDDVEGCLKVLQPVIDDLKQDICDSQVFKDLTNKYDDLERTKQKLHEEISIIRLRRILPGRCKFCPL
jgi:hypothetical protein